MASRKRVFIGLLLLTCVIICILVIILFILPWIGIGEKNLKLLSFVLGSGIILIVGWLFLTILVKLVFGYEIAGFHFFNKILIKYLLSLMELIGSVFRIPKERVRNSFIQVNNELVKKYKLKFAPNDVLLLLPHCIQRNDCSIRINSIDNCKGCGRCKIAKLRDLANNSKICIAVASGGTVARKIIIELRPKFIIAVACERDLASGIKDVFPLPVFGILNERPFGPCINTDIDINILKRELNTFINNNSLEDL